MVPGFAMRSRKQNIIVLALVIGGAGVTQSCLPSTKSSANRPIPLTNRRVMKICPDKALLLREDLKRIAQTFNIVRGKELSIADIFTLNQECRLSQQEETLKLDPCQVSPSCKTGALYLPIK